MPEETNILCIASVKCDDRRASKPLSNIAAKETKDAMKETRRPSLTNERGSPMTTPRGGTVRGFTRPVSSRGESNTGTPATVEGRKESRRMVSGPAARGGKTIPMARTLKRNPRFPNKVSTLDEVIPTTSEGELQARIERVPSPATQRHRSVEASHVPSARNSQERLCGMGGGWNSSCRGGVGCKGGPLPAAPDLGAGAGIQYAAVAPGAPSLQANPLGHTTSNSISYVAAARTVQNAPNAYPSSHSATAAPQSIQGLSSWPTVWVPQAVPATPLTRHSMGQTLISGAVNAPVNAQAVIHREEIPDVQAVCNGGALTADATDCQGLPREVGNSTAVTLNDVSKNVSITQDVAVRPLRIARARDTFACQNLPRDTSEMAQCADVNPDYAAADGSLERTLQQATAVPTRGSSEVISSKHPATPAPAPKPQPKARPADEQAKQAQAAARKRIAAQFKTLADADKTADPSSAVPKWRKGGAVSDSTAGGGKDQPALDA
eukprot:g19115.t1